jgi:geranylgeranyl pyrophosphate synthase
MRYTAMRAREEADLAIGSLAALPPSRYREGLIALAEFAVSRRF